ncbi:snRNA-activating protein complex subunit 5 [Bufo bufo]|uniref:snRNA-activating protein complex subunit 5 n=1 Tax=Bufo bufo TaxID=8384 RepID=UPI001ABE05B0|nr:snRNA-activating protein complex subunit 5 [Bufo bufo]
MLSRLQELKKEEETLLKIKAALHDQLNRLKVEELALQSMITAGEVEQEQQSHGVQPEVDSVNVDDEEVINQTELQLGIMDYNQEEEEEEEEEDSDT